MGTKHFIKLYFKSPKDYNQTLKTSLNNQNAAPCYSFHRLHGTSCIRSSYRRPTSKLELQRRPNCCVLRHQRPLSANHWQHLPEPGNSYLLQPAQYSRRWRSAKRLLKPHTYRVLLPPRKHENDKKICSLESLLFEKTATP